MRTEAEATAGADAKDGTVRDAASRRWLLGLAAVGALGASVGWQRWGSSPDPTAAALARLWQLELPTPAGPPLALRAFQGRPLLVNFWAAWCQPCVAEMPELDRFAATWQLQGGQVLGLAIDQAEPVKHFLTQTPVSFPIALAGATGLNLVRDLGNSAGGLPFTVLISAEGEVHGRKLGATTEAELLGWAAALRKR
ncbi:TlpA family protein disulfide reductase [Ideonella azotifigens]|uniref:TlpA disulfide reductase family protein n=2 Tax=Ideonella azotifigens TaxID=513160 RepID=A0ABP3VTP6_9BURK|nr:TlpA disulfide reductase family protein [Ideonella azotifigens]MCD2339562.1 TlpA family protein disulfide reductase [Ideonella azotifigens]